MTYEGAGHISGVTVVPRPNSCHAGGDDLRRASRSHLRCDRRASPIYVTPEAMTYEGAGHISGVTVVRRPNPRCAGYGQAVAQA